MSHRSRAQAPQGVYLQRGAGCLHIESAPHRRVNCMMRGNALSLGGSDTTLKERELLGGASVSRPMDNGVCCNDISSRERRAALPSNGDERPPPRTVVGVSPRAQNTSQ